MRRNWLAEDYKVDGIAVDVDLSPEEAAAIAKAIVPYKQTKFVLPDGQGMNEFLNKNSQSVLKERNGKDIKKINN